MTRSWVFTGVAACILCAGSAPANAWTEPGHVVIAEIAYDILSRDHPKHLERVVEAIAQHPDQASFRVAVGGATGEEKKRRLFAQCSRWAMDAAGSVFDHPTWHVGGRDLSRDAQHPVDRSSRFGNAGEAFALNLATWQDGTATASEQALSLCWVMHIVGDVHAPVHVAQEVSSALPGGDRWGTRQFVREAPGSTPVGLHRYWDFAITKDATPAHARALAAEIAETFGGAAEPPSVDGAVLPAFATWVDDTFELARSTAYAPDLATSTTSADAPVVAASYRSRAQTAAHRQAWRAGARLAWILSRDP